MNRTDTDTVSVAFDDLWTPGMTHFVDYPDAELAQVAIDQHLAAGGTVALPSAPALPAIPDCTGLAAINRYSVKLTLGELYELVGCE